MKFTSVCGIIAEFNPLHKGHKLLIDAAKVGGNRVVCAISGNFVQRGDLALISKQKRAQSALLCGADLVVEIPVLWSMSTAQNFALGGVFSLINAGCDEIIFGSECGNIDTLKTVADALLTDEFKGNLENELKLGVTFAAARQRALEGMGICADVLQNANDTLGIEYINAAKFLNSNIKFRCIKREGAAHDSNVISGDFVSASLIRQYIKEDKIGFCERFMPLETRGIINEDNTADIARIERAILGILRQRNADDFRVLPDISEGIENKLYFAIRKATSLDELFNIIKTKRYTMARIRRLVLSAALGFDGQFFMKAPPYTRVLGFSQSGAELLKRQNTFVPIITKVSEVSLLESKAKKVFDTESRASDLWALGLKKPLECGFEFTAKILKME